jgi:hypothetical protein
MHRLVLSTMLVLTGCTAGWNSVVQYSDQPSPSDQPLVEGVYETVLRSYLDSRRDTVVVLDAGPAPASPDGRSIRAMAHPIPGHWADTLKREVQTALSDTAQPAKPAPSPLERVASRLGIRFVSELPVQPTTHTRPLPRMSLSAPGFNQDSTIAILDVAFHCGPLCGSGQVLYLARKPGRAWRIWHRELTWVS